MNTIYDGKSTDQAYRVARNLARSYLADVLTCTDDGVVAWYVSRARAHYADSIGFASKHGAEV